MYLRKYVTLFFLVYIFTNISLSQINFKAQYLGRAEFRNGYGDLADTNLKPGSFMSQRFRLGATYIQDKYKLNFSIQDVRTWGSTSNGGIDNKGLLSVCDANVEYLFSKKISAKIGRQHIAYDDERIFGEADWSMQSRRHDAAILKYEDSTLKIHGGFAYNQEFEASKSILYTIKNNYQNLEFLWVNKIFGSNNMSFLFLNKVDAVKNYTHTFGLRNAYKKDKFSLLGYGYYQTGVDGNKKVNAYDLCLELSYSPLKEWQFKLGTEILSGTSQTDTSNMKKYNNSFSPFFGTNHKFNGYMDYYFVGNHANSVGLMDSYLKVTLTKSNFIYSLNGHYFNAATNVRDKRFMNEYKAMKANLGGEIDFTITYIYTKNVSMQLGYSQYFGTTTLTNLRGGSLATISNWAFLMLKVRP